MPSPQDSADEPDRQGRRFLIAAGTARYKHLPDDAQLPSVSEDIRLIVDLFTKKLGYERVLPELGKNPTSNALRLKLSTWLRHPDRRASDVIVFYYSGHGDVSRKHYLLTSDSQETNLIGTALPTEALAEMLDGSPCQEVLVILDTCYSGQGIGDFSKVAAEVGLGLAKGVRPGIYAIAAARPKGEAVQGAFLRGIH